MVETTKKNLSRLEMSIQSDYCIIVNGALSSGKTSLIQYLADKHNRKLIKYQMDDFMDSKVSLIKIKSIKNLKNLIINKKKDFNWKLYMF
jgi:predicted AAA+ superfamily ATPase